MVIEYLTFEVGPDERAEWLEVEGATWSRFLERQPGFVSKQMWVERGQEHLIHAVIQWESMELWQSIGADEMAEVDAAMGPWFRDATCRIFDVVRDS